MKKIAILLTSALVAAMIFASCGSTPKETVAARSAITGNEKTVTDADAGIHK